MFLLNSLETSWQPALVILLSRTRGSTEKWGDLLLATWTQVTEELHPILSDFRHLSMWPPSLPGVQTRKLLIKVHGFAFQRRLVRGVLWGGLPMPLFNCGVLFKDELERREPGKRGHWGWFPPPTKSDGPQSKSLEVCQAVPSALALC